MVFLGFPFCAIFYSDINKEYTFHLITKLYILSVIIKVKGYAETSE